MDPRLRGLRRHFHDPAFHYGATLFSTSMINGVFVTFYVGYFLRYVCLSPFGFTFGQLIYCVWNMLNDPLFGWLGDRYALAPNALSARLLRGSSVLRAFDRFFELDAGSILGEAKPLERRKPRVFLGGIALCVGFVFMWCVPAKLGITNPLLAAALFTVMMVVYDGGLSYTTVAHSALLSDCVPSERGDAESLKFKSGTAAFRARCCRYGSVMATFGALGTLVAFQVWPDLPLPPSEADAEEGAEQPAQSLFWFRLWAVAVAGLALIGFAVTSFSKRLKERASKPSSADRVDSRGSAFSTIAVFARELLQHRAFWLVGVVACLQQFTCTFNTNFFSSIYQSSVHPLSGGAGYILGVTPVPSVLLGSTFVLPHAIVAWLSVLIERGKVQLYAVFAMILAMRIVLCVATLALFLQVLEWSPDEIDGLSGGTISYAASVSVLFLVANRILAEVTCRLMPQVMCVVADIDQKCCGRSVSQAGSVIGAFALLTKPSQSIASLTGASMLGMYESSAVTWLASILSEAPQWVRAFILTNGVTGTIAPLMAVSWSGLGMVGGFTSKRDEEVRFNISSKPRNSPHDCRVTGTAGADENGRLQALPSGRSAVRFEEEIVPHSAVPSVTTASTAFSGDIPYSSTGVSPYSYGSREHVL